MKSLFYPHKVSSPVFVPGTFPKLFFIAATAVFCASTLPGQSPVLVADAHTSATSVNGNFGTNPALAVSSNNAAYIRFDLSRVLSDSTSATDISKAVVKFYVSKVTTPGKIDVYPLLADWNERTISTANAPPYGQLAATTQQIGRDAQGNYITVDLTALVKQWLGDGGGQNALPNFGVVLAARPVDSDTPQVIDVNLDSKENSQTSHDATLNVQFEKPAAGLQTVATDATIDGDGTTANPLGIAPGSITGTYLANGAVTPDKISDGAVTSSKITAPLSLTSADPGFTLSVTNSGAGAALTATGAINTSTQYNIGGKRVLGGSGTQNLFAGIDSGAANTTGSENAFFGQAAGFRNSTGSRNTFLGLLAGFNNTAGKENTYVGGFAGQNGQTGESNSFFGFVAGLQNQASDNSFFGRGAGYSNTTGTRNSFFGRNAADENNTGSDNSAFGFNAGKNNFLGSHNSFFGSAAGFTNANGSNITIIGSGADVQSPNLKFASAFGSRAVVNSDDTIVIGKTAGVYDGQSRPADTVRIPGTLSIDGSFQANIVEAAIQFNLAGLRILSNAGTNNFFAGIGAGAANAGTGNTFVGADAGTTNGAGFNNSFFGFGAGKSNTTGGGNAFFGTSGRNNTTGGQNSFFGHNTGFANLTGAGNSFFGSQAGMNSQTGSFNTFLGLGAGQMNISGSENTFVGLFAQGSATGTRNTLLGSNSKLGANGLSYATAIGADAIVSTDNTIVLGRSLDTVQVPGALNVASFGASIVNAVTQYNLNGARILSNSGSNNLFAGVGAGAANTGGHNTFVGSLAGNQNTAASANSFFGYAAGQANTASNNSFFGYRTGVANTTGIDNSFFGSGAGDSNTTGNKNAFFGLGSGGSNTTGIQNAYFGALTGVATNADFNSFFGEGAGNTTSSGGRNAFFGWFAGGNNQTGFNNTLVGSNSGFDTFPNSGSGNTLLGANTRASSNISNATAIGANAQVTQSHSLVLGGGSANVGIGNTAPKTKFHVTGGKIYVDAPGEGVILRSPGGNCFELTVTNTGTLTTLAVMCPL